MFEIGDKIVYPMYGAGIIEDIEEETADEEVHYKIKLVSGNLVIKVAESKIERIGIRHIYDEETFFSEIGMAVKKPIVCQSNWNLRYKENLEKIKSGNLCQVAEVARMLMIRENERGLSGVEKKMLTNVKQILVSELVLSKGVAKEKAEELLTIKLLWYNFL